MLSVTVAREVPAGVDVVWATFTDLVHRPSWLSTVEDVEPLTRGRFEVGTRWRETRQAAGRRRVTEEFVVTACEPQRCCVLALAGDGADYKLGFTFTPIEVGRHRGDTNVAVTLVGTPSSRASRLLSFFLGGVAARTVAGALSSDLDALAAGSAARQVARLHTGTNGHAA
jgi:hypothetical protein